jgi:hypothetical protein
MASTVQVQITASLGIAPSLDGTDDHNGNHIFLSSDQYLAAALFAGGQQLYPLPSPVAFSYSGPEGNWSITPFVLPENVLPGYNSSTIANITVVTYGIDTKANCEMADITFRDNGVVTATVDQCSFDFLKANSSFTRWHFANSTQCNNASKSDIAFKAFVYAVYRPTGYDVRDPSQFVVMFCQPSIMISKLSATLSVSPHGVGPLVGPPVVLETFLVGSNAGDPNLGNLLQPPLNGMAVNGFDMAERVDEPLFSRNARVIVTQSIIFEGIYGAQLDHMPLDDVNSTDDWCTCTRNCFSRS